ncbi:MAG TPA: hypothetical protein VJH89_00090, partial [Patescibacteria group bacterium]|nr:hypothetical protein [Patescibacteria group bacterium]
MKSLLLTLSFLTLPLFGWLFFSSAIEDIWNDPDGQSILRAGKDFQRAEDGKSISAIKDNELFSSFDRLKNGFTSLDFALVSERAFAAESIAKNVITDKEKNTLTSAYAIGDITVTTKYEESKNHTLGGFSPVKQTITLTNHTADARTVDFSNRIHIP